MPAGEFPDDPADPPVGGLDKDWCYFDRRGKIVIRIPMGPNFEQREPLRERPLAGEAGFTWGYKDATGAWAIPPKYNDAQNFEGGLARVEIVINVNGKEVPRKPSAPSPTVPRWQAKTT